MRNREPRTAGLVEPLAALADDRGVGDFDRPDGRDESPRLGEAVTDTVGVGSGFVVEALCHRHGAVEHEIVLEFSHRES